MVRPNLFPSTTPRSSEEKESSIHSSSSTSVVVEVGSLRSLLVDIIIEAFGVKVGYNGLVAVSLVPEDKDGRSSIWPISTRLTRMNSYCAS